MPEDLFSPLALRGVTLRNRIVCSPMCQYSSVDGLANDWHLVHLGSRAVGGAAVVFTEAAAVEARGRISPEDLGIWNDAQIEPLGRVARFIGEQGAIAGIQLAHAGRKASTYAPGKGQGAVPADDGGWTAIGPSPLPYAEGYPLPAPMQRQEIEAVIAAFAGAAERARQAGFQFLEIHAAHGYLLHSFLSPLSNERTDEYGGSFSGRTRLLREVVSAVRSVWPEGLPLSVRISASEWVPGGWTIADSVELARGLGPLGVDLIDCSSGGNVSKAKIPAGAGYQTPFAATVKRETGLRTGAVGLITAPQQADQIIRNGEADLVFIARQLLRDPYWPLRAADRLGAEIDWPRQYERGRW